ncbi:MAG: hypothetical protein AAGD09_08630 [Cyanobacteria bacterium P01_F01_bin.56]
MSNCSSSLIDHFQRKFDRLAADADMGFIKDLQNTIQRQRKQCGA